MSLARMLSDCRDELECDLMEVYGVLEMRQLSPRKAAVFACGLGNDSRTATALAKSGLTFSEALKAAEFDRLGQLLYVSAKAAGFKHFKKLPQLLDSLYRPQENTQVVGFDSGEEFLQEYKRIVR